VRRIRARKYLEMYEEAKKVISEGSATVLVCKGKVGIF
jgi:hypothetical protein